MSASERLEQILNDLKRRQVNAARRNKPTMWAYYLSVRRALGAWFRDCTGDGGVAWAALALVQIAERHQHDGDPVVAARWAAMAVYARRILREWAPGRRLERKFGVRGDLSWLRERAEED